MTPAFKFDLFEPPLGYHAPHVRLDLDDCPHLVSILPPDQIPSGVSLQPHDVPPQVAEPVRQHSSSDQRLQPHVPHPHPLVPLPLNVSLPVLLYGHGGSPEAQEPPAIDPPSDGPLQNQNLLCEDSVALLLQKQVVSVFEKHFVVSQLVVGAAEHGRTDFGGCRPTLGAVSRGNPGDQESVPLDELAEAVPDRVAGSPDSYRLHHPGVSQLAAAQVPVKHHRFLVFVGLDAPDEEGLAVGQGAHQRVQTLLELGGERRGALPRLRPHANIVCEDLLQEFVVGDGDQLEEVSAERIAVLLQEASSVVEHDSGEVVEAEAGVDVGFRFEVVPVVPVGLVQFGQHRLVRALGELALFVDQRHYV